MNLQDEHNYKVYIIIYWVNFLVHCKSAEYFPSFILQTKAAKP